MAKTELRVCKKHGETIFVLRKNGYFKCRACAVSYVDKRRKDLKQKSVDYLGGKCQHCNYSKCIGALDFHHLDPKEKDFGLSNGVVMGWEKIKTELDKCILLCANCHREEHDRLRLPR